MDVLNQNKALGYHSSNDLHVLQQTLKVWVLPADGGEVTESELCSTCLSDILCKELPDTFQSKHQNKSNLEILFLKFSIQEQFWGCPVITRLIKNANQKPVWLGD